MIVNGIDIVGYKWAKFIKSDNIRHEVDGNDIILYGNTSDDFSYLFNIVSSVPIKDSEYIDVTPGVISKIGSVSVQSNSVEDILLNIILTDTEESKVIVTENHVMIICNVKDKSTINLGALSDKIKLLNLAKGYGESLGNIRNARIRKDVKVVEPYYNEVIYDLSGSFRTNMNYTRALNRLNYEIHKLLPEFTFVLGKKDRTNDRPNTIYCSYSQMEIEHKHFFRSLRRNIMHVLPVTYEFRVVDDIRYAKLQYEMSNYDFITNICELTVNDDNDNKGWVFAIHWTIEPFEVDLLDPKTGADTVSRSVKCTANIHLFTSIDNYIHNLIAVKDALILRIESHYEPCNEIGIITIDDTLMD